MASRDATTRRRRAAQGGAGEVAEATIAVLSPSRAADESATIAPEIASRDVPQWVQVLLWGKAAGRCQFAGCNRVSWKSEVTQETHNVAEKAHIRAFSVGGPREAVGTPTHLVNDLSNLMLLCHDCHVTIDKRDGPIRYTADLLRHMKREHEDRVEVVTGIVPSLKSHVVTFGTYVGEHQALPAFASAACALFPHRWPAQQLLIELGTRVGPLRDRDVGFWATERKQQAFQFDRQVRQAMERGLTSHLSLFALAPQPLLIDLGVRLGELTDVDVYQLHREPKGWLWPTGPVTSQVLRIDRPPFTASGAPALVFAISANVARERITKVLGEDAACWVITVERPHNDVLTSRDMLHDFRTLMRPLLNEIKMRHGHETPLHVFPAMPVSCAVEFGRVRSPKAEPAWHLYDEQQGQGGFVHAFTISAGATE